MASRYSDKTTLNNQPIFFAFTLRLDQRQSQCHVVARHSCKTDDVVIVKRRCKMTNALASISPYYLIFFLSFFATLPVRALVYHIRADDCNAKPGAALYYLTYLTLPASSLL